MPLTTINYELKPNIYDNKQRSWDPDGTYQETPGLPVLEAPYGLGATSITTNSATITWSLTETDHTSQEIQQWIEGTSTSWTSHPVSTPVVNPDVRQIYLSGLPDGTQIRVRVRAVYEDNT